MMTGRSKGFTLIELAIVITIIGLIAGVIFVSGGSLFQSSKTAKIISIVNDIGEAASQFRSTYKALPGDLKIAANEIPNVHPSCKDGDNDEIIEADPSAESSCVIEHLFRAGLFKADGADVNGKKIVQSPFGGSITVMHPSESVANGVDWHRRYVPVVVQITGLPCDVIEEIDRKIDDDKLDDGLARVIDADGDEQAACTDGSVLVIAL